jgi:hypothetical protein
MSVNNALLQLNIPFVFTGGAAVSLYVDDVMQEASRPTGDVDVVVEVTAYGRFAKMEEQLRQAGFANDTESGIICRYIFQGLTVDIMPIGENVLGFSNKWYEPGFKKAIHVEIGGNGRVKIFPVTYFLAAKLEAFKGRGRNDGRTSNDFEDIVFVLNGCSSIWQELNMAETLVKKYLQQSFGSLLQQPFIYEWVSCHIDFAEQYRVDDVLNNLRQFVLHV